MEEGKNGDENDEGSQGIRKLGWRYLKAERSPSPMPRYDANPEKAGSRRNGE